MLEADPPLHTRTRGLLWRALSGPTVEALRERFAGKAAQLVDALAARAAHRCRPRARRGLRAQPSSRRRRARRGGRRTSCPTAPWPSTRSVRATRLFEESFANVQKVAGWIEAQCARDALRPGGLGAHVYDEVDKGELSENEAGPARPLDARRRGSTRRSRA